MKTINHFEQNRPVHLARRDVYYEQAIEKLSGQPSEFHADMKLEDYEDTLFMLRVARQHARFSIRESGKNEKDEQFSAFINLLAGNVKAILSMMNLKHTVASSEGSFFNFLGDNQASIALQAEEYQRRANDIVRSIHNTLKLAEEPFNKLKVENATILGDEEMERYNKAREHFLQLIKSGRHNYRIAPSSRKIAHF